MKLFTKDIDKKLFAQYETGSELDNQVVVAKIFNPYGRGTWYIINSDPNEPDYLWAIVDLFEVEVGSVSRSELENLKVPPLGLGLERDLYFQPVNAAQLLEGLMSGENYKSDGEIDIAQQNKDMLLNYAEELENHTKEFEEAAKKAENVEPWVIAKMERSTTDLSDVTHYLDSENEIRREYGNGEGEEMAKGGVTYLGDYNSDNKNYYFRIFKDSIGSFGWVFDKKYNEGYLYALNQFDKDYYSHIKLKDGEYLFRYKTSRMVSDAAYLIKINLNKSLLYFMTDADSDDDKNPKFDSRGIKAEYIVVEKDKYVNGGEVEYIIKDDSDKYYSRDISSGNVKWNDSQDMAYMFKKTEVEDIKSKLESEGYKNLSIQEYDKNWWKKMADGGTVFENMRKKEIEIKFKIAQVIGIDEAIKYLNMDFIISPFQLIKSAVFKGFITKDEINQNIWDAAVSESYNIDEDYRDSGYGISSSDINGFLYRMLRDAGIDIQVVDNRYQRMADGGEIDELFELYDINGKKIEEGDMVKSMQPSGGILSPSEGQIGVVEKTKDAFGQDDFRIRFRREGKNFDQFILLNGKINEIISKGKKMADGGLIQPDKPIEKMNKLELMRFVSKIDPTKHFYPKTTLAGRKQAKNIYQKYVDGKDSKMAKGGGIGFIPMDLEEKLMLTAKWGGTDIKGVIGILNAMIDSEVTDQDLVPKPTKSGSAYEKALAKKTQEIWAKIKPKYKGDFEGNMYYSTILRLVERSGTDDEILKRYKPFRKFQKDYADGGMMAKGGEIKEGKVTWKDDGRYGETYLKINGSNETLFLRRGLKQVWFGDIIKYKILEKNYDAKTNEKGVSFNFKGDVIKLISINRNGKEIPMDVYADGGDLESKQDELLKSIYPQIEKLFSKNGLKLDKDYGFTDGSNKSYLPQFSYQREGDKLNKVVVTYYSDGFEVLGEIEIELEDGVDIEIEFPNWNIKEEGKGFMAKGGEMAKVGEPYDSMTKYQLEKEYKKLNEKRDTLKKKYGKFDSQEISENEKEIEKIITLLYGEDFSGKGQKFKYADGGDIFEIGQAITNEYGVDKEDGISRGEIEDVLLKEKNKLLKYKGRFIKTSHRQIPNFQEIIDNLRKDGWIIFDNYKMADGGTIDENWRVNEILDGRTMEQYRLDDLNEYYNSYDYKKDKILLGKEEEGIVLMPVYELHNYDIKIKGIPVRYISGYNVYTNEGKIYKYSDLPDENKQEINEVFYSHLRSYGISPKIVTIRVKKKMAEGGMMAKGGKVTFADKVKSIKSRLLKGKKVSPKVQKDYGKTYSPAEAEDSAKRIVGSITAKERLMNRMKKAKK
jgi:hypothetical protein